MKLLKTGLILLGLLVAPFNASLAAVNNPRMSDAEYCAKYFQGTFRPTDNARLANIGTKVVANFGLNVRVVFCIGTGSDPLDPPSARMSAWKDVLYVSLGNEYIRELGGSIEAIVAHEIAHYVVPGGQMCSGHPREKYIACESSVDEAAALVVGKDAMLSMLNDFSRYLRAHKGNIEGAEDNIRDIRQRMHMLQRIDLPN